jgi:hypothetical protein
LLLQLNSGGKYISDLSKWSIGIYFLKLAFDTLSLAEEKNMNLLLMNVPNVALSKAQEDLVYKQLDWCLSDCGYDGPLTINYVLDPSIEGPLVLCNSIGVPVLKGKDFEWRIAVAVSLFYTNFFAGINIETSPWHVGRFH